MSNSPDNLQDPTEAWRQFAASLVEGLMTDVVYVDPSVRAKDVEDSRGDLAKLKSSVSVPEQLHAAQRMADMFLGRSKAAQGAVEKAIAGFPAVFEELGILAKQAGVAGTDSDDALARPLPTGEFLSVPRRLVDALKALGVREEERRRHQTALIDNLQTRISILESLSGERATAGSSDGMAFALDACTGLPGKEEAEMALREALDAPASSTPKLAVVFYVHRLNLINKKYGHVVGDSILLLSSQHVATRIIRQNDALFRWTGPALLGILEREEPASVIKSEVNRLLSASLERYFESQDRSVFLPIRLTGQVIEIRGRTVSEIIDDVGTFILRASEQS